jgi:hypothetical protein
VSVNPPALTIALGSVGIPQVDVIEALVHLGATKEVSSWELHLQNWNGKYSPNGAYPLNVGQDGYICIGRGANVPQLITTRTESVKFQSSPTEHYVIVAGRCWGEKLFRQTVTKDYSGFKGEAIVKNLLDYYSGLSHVRASTELVEDTDTTFTDLKVQDAQVWDLLQRIASDSDKNGVIGYDFRTAPDGKFEFFPRGTKTSPVSLTDKIESYEYWKEIIAIRNKIIIYGAADKSSPLDKTETVESLAPASGAWTLYAGVSMTLDATKTYGEAVASIKLVTGSTYYGGLYFTFTTPQNLNTYPKLYLALLRDTHIRADGFSVELFDTSYRAAGQVLSNVNDNDPSAFALDVGQAFAANWRPQAGFDWTQVSIVRIDGWLVDTLTSGAIWVMQLFFGGARYSSLQQNTASQAAYGLRELVDIDEELWSDTECLLRARAILATMKDPAEYITLKSTIIDYGNTPLFPADTIAVALPNENINGNFRILSAEYHVKAETGELEITLELGREKSLLADYVYALRSKVDRVNRYKIARL